jgi:hypothetical protein
MPSSQLSAPEQRTSHALRLHRTQRSQLSAPLHSIEQPSVAAQLALRHAFLAVHAIAQVALMHDTPSPSVPPHESSPLHVISHGPSPSQRTPRGQEPAPLHTIAHRGPSHVTLAPQLPAPVHLTSHASPSGHAGQSADSHVMTQTPAAHVPGQRSSHTPPSAVGPSTTPAASSVARPPNEHAQTTAPRTRTITPRICDRA